MKVLFIGGTGIISTACAQLAMSRGFQLTVLNRGQRNSLPGLRQITADINDARAAARQSPINAGMPSWISFVTRRRKSSNASRSSRKNGAVHFHQLSQRLSETLAHYLITESTPLANPFWDYSRNKIACEERLQRALREEAFPMTIVRPSFTYGDTAVPLALNSWPKSFTAVDRMRRGKPVIIPGDGLTLWTMTHNSDFAKALIGLLGHQGAIGHAVSHHIR
jgi:nucleoside-diphosphate-sugar epimerase